MSGSITGIVKDAASRQPLETVNVALIRLSDNAIVTGTSTKRDGSFSLANIPLGKYRLRYTLLGYETVHSAPLALEEQNLSFKAGTIVLSETSVKMDSVTVSAEVLSFSAAIDRKVYNVQQDVLSTTGSVSDLLQNVPSVQVDVDGTVSLRGSANVQILINGKPSPLMAGGASDVLQQIPANSVEKIEVITNPSAKFKPDGTSGLINIVLKKEANLGVNGSVGANYGVHDRYGINSSGNYNSGGLNLFGTYNFRQDERNTFFSDTRLQYDSEGSAGSYRQEARTFARPYSHFITLGFDYLLNDADKAGISANYRYRGYTSNDTALYEIAAADGDVSSRYHRMRVDYDKTPVGGATAFYQHDYVKEDHTLRFELNVRRLFDEEDNHFANLYQIPSGLMTYDNRRIREYDKKVEVTADYHNKLAEHAVLELGYDGSVGTEDYPFIGSNYDSVQHAIVADVRMDNHFIYGESIHALYGTYETSMGAFSTMCGLRLEQAAITSDQVSLGTRDVAASFHLFPTVHLAYRLNEIDQLQLNYSLRVNRPDAGDLNPFPEYQNPRNLSAGNPYLKPEYIHSLEFGVEIQNEALSIVPGIFYRNRFNGFTNVTRSLNDSTLLTTMENLSTDRSGGLEMVVAGTIGSSLSLNLSANAFYEQIDATNLGYGSTKSAASWNASLNCNYNATKGTMLQINSNYRSSRLTPQGNIRPSCVVNLGLRQDLLEGRLALTATIADVFATMNRKGEIRTDWIDQRTFSTRDARVAFIGLTYHFGTPPAHQKDKALQYDDNG